MNCASSFAATSEILCRGTRSALLCESDCSEAPARRHPGTPGHAPSARLLRAGAACSLASAEGSGLTWVLLPSARRPSRSRRRLGTRPAHTLGERLLRWRAPPASAKNPRLTRVLPLPERRQTVAPRRGTRLARALCERLLRRRAHSPRPRARGRRGPCLHPTGDSPGGASAAARGAHAPCTRLCGAMQRWAAALAAPAPPAAAPWRLFDSGSSSIARPGTRRREAMRRSSAALVAPAALAAARSPASAAAASSPLAHDGARRCDDRRRRSWRRLLWPLPAHWLWHQRHRLLGTRQREAMPRRPAALAAPASLAAACSQTLAAAASFARHAVRSEMPGRSATPVTPAAGCCLLLDSAAANPGTRRRRAMRCSSTALVAPAALAAACSSALGRSGIVCPRTRRREATDDRRRRSWRRLRWPLPSSALCGSSIVCLLRVGGRRCDDDRRRPWRRLLWSLPAQFGFSSSGIVRPGTRRCEAMR